jgi:fluoride ion exporter CrcB/FEX
MREFFAIPAAIGLFFFLATCVMTAVAIRYATPSLLWDLILWGGVIGMFSTVATFALFVSSQLTGRPFLWPTLAINLGICLIVGGFVWHSGGFSSEEKKKFSADIRNALVYLNFVPPSLFMVAYNTPNGLTVSPIFYLIYFQVTNQQDIPIRINEYRVSLSGKKKGLSLLRPSI